MIGMPRTGAMKTMRRDDKLRANIERRERLTERLRQLRGEHIPIDMPKNCFSKSS